MLENWAPILIFFILATGFGLVSLIMSYLFGVRISPNPSRNLWQAGIPSTAR